MCQRRAACQPQGTTITSSDQDERHIDELAELVSAAWASHRQQRISSGRHTTVSSASAVDATPQSAAHRQWTSHHNQQRIGSGRHTTVSSASAVDVTPQSAAHQQWTSHHSQQRISGSSGQFTRVRDLQSSNATKNPSIQIIMVSIGRIVGNPCTQQNQLSWHRNATLPT